MFRRHENLGVVLVYGWTVRQLYVLSLHALEEIFDAGINLLVLDRAYAKGFDVS